MNIVEWLFDGYNLVSPWFWLAWLGTGLIIVALATRLNQASVFLYFTLSGILWVTAGPVIGGIWGESWLFFLYHAIACLIYGAAFFAVGLGCERLGRSGGLGEGAIGAMAPVTLFPVFLIIGVLIMAARALLA